MAAGSREDELGLQLRREIATLSADQQTKTCLTHLEKREDYPLMGFGQDRKALFVSEEDAGGEDGRFDWLPEPLIDHSVRWHIWSNFECFSDTTRIGRYYL